MADHDDLIRKLHAEINRCKAARLDSRKEYDDQRLSLSALNSRLAEYDQRIAEAQAELRDLLAEVPLPEPVAGPAEAGDGHWDVFISYQRDAEEEARELYQRLSADGLRVWQDVNAIRHSSRWSLAINSALQHSDRLVLLMTPAAMASGEVFNEWFYFYNKKKPIHCLMLATCDPHYQLLPYQYLEWREPSGRDYARLLRELRSDFTQPTAITTSPIVSAPHALETPYSSPFADLLEAARDPDGSIAFTAEQIRRLAEHKPADLAEYWLGRVAEWSLPRYQLDQRFVNLTLLLDKGEEAQQRWQSADAARFSDLREVLAQVDDRALVLLGAPGSGKSTLLRRLQLDHSLDQLRADGDRVTLFVPLNSYRDGIAPAAWLAEQWATRYPDLPPLADYLRAGRAILLLDALNEMPHRSTAEYHEKVMAWRALTQTIVGQGNRAIFSCRSLDYSASLSSKDLRVPQVEVQPMSPEQVRQFIAVYSPTHADTIWRDLDGTPQFDLFRTPIYLKLLLDQVERYQQVPKGKAQLFTQFVRQQIARNLDHPLLAPNGLLSGRDHAKLTQDAWKTHFELPERGLLIPNLSRLAFAMQEKGLETEGALVRIDYDDACDLLDSSRNKDILRAGVALTVLDEDIARDEITFFHQLLQEFFAARRLAQEPNPALVHVEWQVDQVRPTLDEVLATLADGDPLPPLPQTGWEETTLTAAPMARDPNAFIRDLMAHNLPLAARCAASPEVNTAPDLKREMQQALIARAQDFANADLRARIAAGLALGELGDPRFERRTGPHGDYLLPPLVTIPAGMYPIGDDDGPYANEKPAHTVALDAFEMGAFPVTNAEYALFIEAGGYEDERWWDTDEALAWLRGEGSTDGQKAGVRDLWNSLQSWSEDGIRGLVTQNRITSEQAEQWIDLKGWSEDKLERQLDEWFPSGQTYRQPEFWDDTRFNSPAQPVVGVTWFEARAYCNWLSANVAPAPLNPLSHKGRGDFPDPAPERERWVISPELAARMTEVARKLRREATRSEDILWQALRNRQLDGYRFRRQEAVGAFVLDFYCPQARLAVEIDGSIHDLPDQQQADAERQRLVESLGIRFVRVMAEDVEQNLPAVLDKIRTALLPSPRAAVGEGPGVRVFTLPTEAQFEAAARGSVGRQYPYGGEFDVTRGNTFESHIRRTTPVGIFDNATPEGAFDLTGNAYTWTTSLYDQAQFPYPYHSEDGRENIHSNTRRVLRGGSWHDGPHSARAVSRSSFFAPDSRDDLSGFRLCRVRAPQAET